MDLKELNEKIINWADEKGILANSTPLKQMEKTQEEIDELKLALVYQENNCELMMSSKGSVVSTSEEIKDGLGDSFVTLIIQCRLQNLTLEECIEHAYNIISKREGKMIDGFFVKD